MLLLLIFSSLWKKPNFRVLFDSLTTTIQCVAGCPDEWLSYRDKCYFFSKDLHSFDDARATCELKSASLVIINDMEEQVTRTPCNLMLLCAVCQWWLSVSSVLLWPQKWLKRQIFGKGYFWMGLTDREEENMWRWLDGTEPTFTSVLTQEMLGRDILFQKNTAFQ